jgi:ABC-type amino acid transport substrate-binding protein
MYSFIILVPVFRGDWRWIAVLKNVWPLVACLSLLISCEQKETVNTGSSAVLAPLELVEQLAEENEQITLSIPAGLASYPEEIRTILERGYIIFGMTSADQKPFFYEDAQTGRLIGLDVEIAYEIANRLGVRAVFNREAASFDDVVFKVVNKEVDVALSKLSRTIRRAAMVRFTRPYITFRQALLVNRLELAKVTTEENLPLFIRHFTGTMAVIKNSSYISYAGTNFPYAIVKTYDTWGECVDALFAGEVLAVYRDEGEILIVTETRENAAILTKSVFISDKQDPIAMAVSYDAPLLEAWLNTFLDEYLRQHSEELAVWRIVKKHFGEL